MVGSNDDMGRTPSDALRLGQVSQFAGRGVADGESEGSHPGSMAQIGR